MKTSVLVPLLALLALMLTAPVGFAGDDIGTKLQNQYAGKILFLRHPGKGDSLEYDSNGNSRKSSPEMPWTVYSGMLVEKVEFRPDGLRLEGKRILFQAAAGGRLAPFVFKRLDRQATPPFKESLKVDIRLDHPPDSMEQAENLLEAVFALSKEDFLNSTPESWRRYLADTLSYGRGQMLEFRAPSAESKPPPDGAGSQASPNDGTPSEPIVRCCRNGVTAPKPLHTPEPAYTEAARYERYQGVTVLEIVVDSTGKVGQLRTVRPLGMGLDEASVRTVKTWIFKPATRNGEPVAVQMNVEVSFNLY